MACVSCQRAKVHRHTKAPLAPFLIPGKRFDHVHFDLMGPLPQGYKLLYHLVARGGPPVIQDRGGGGQGIFVNLGFAFPQLTLPLTEAPVCFGALGCHG